MRFLKIPCLIGLLILPACIWAEATFCDLSGVKVDTADNPNTPYGAPELLKSLITPSFPWQQIGKYQGGATSATTKYDGQPCIQATATDLVTGMTFYNKQNFPIQIGCQGIRVYDPANSPPIDPSLAPIGACYTANSKGQPVKNATVTVQPNDHVVFYAVSGKLKLSAEHHHDGKVVTPNPLQWYQAISGVSITVSVGEHLISLPFIYQLRFMQADKSKQVSEAELSCFMQKNTSVYCQFLNKYGGTMPAVLVNASSFHGINYDKTGLVMNQTYSDASGGITGSTKPTAGFTASGAYQNYVSCDDYDNEDYPQGSKNPDSATEADLQLVYLGALSNSNAIESASDFDVTGIACTIGKGANPPS